MKVNLHISRINSNKTLPTDTREIFLLKSEYLRSSNRRINLSSAFSLQPPAHRTMKVPALFITTMCVVKETCPRDKKVLREVAILLLSLFLSPRQDDIHDTPPHSPITTLLSCHLYLNALRSSQPPL